MCLGTSKRMVAFHAITSRAVKRHRDGGWTALVLSAFVFLCVINCRAEEVPCYTGLASKTSRVDFQIVERADTALHYEPDLEDARFTSIDASAAFPFDDDGRYISSWPSCQNIDGDP